jgi:hypothetical protein
MLRWYERKLKHSYTGTRCEQMLALRVYLLEGYGH